MKTTIKRLIPDPVWDLGRDLYLTGKYAGEWSRAILHPWRRASIKRLAAYKDTHRGERCVIIGNGPSLRNTDVSKIKDEYTFGLNRIYLAFPDWGFKTNYLVSINNLVMEQYAEEIQQLEIPKFLAWRSRQHIKLTDNMMFLHTTYYNPKFSHDVRGRVYEGATVTYVAMQIAFYMGFEQVVLIGVDHSFKAKGKPNETVVSGGDDQSHFDPKYFAKGVRWQLPDLDTSEQAYMRARYAYEQAGREILDATIGGQLTVFPKVDFDTFFG